MTNPPREMGVLLIALGISELIPLEPHGMVFVVLGGLVFWPRGFRAIEGWVGRHFPKTHETGMAFLNRYLGDLERRYPNSTAGSGVSQLEAATSVHADINDRMETTRAL